MLDKDRISDTEDIKDTHTLKPNHILWSTSYNIILDQRGSHLLNALIFFYYNEIKYKHTRCTSRGKSVTGRNASTTRGPIVIFGTNRPSITSTCIQSHPATSTAFIYKKKKKILKVSQEQFSNQSIDSVSDQTILETISIRKLK